MKLKKEEKRRIEDVLIARWVAALEGDTCFITETAAQLGLDSADVPPDVTLVAKNFRQLVIGWLKRAPR